ncbi:hypothetical protein TRFO_17979 [Tritrichomonas foetus]|uniref:Uncharacterized protein n=1 Tax=Tritrichomonas foetus TaxID=1144522 RepID=A0A1J4KR58_9EUKA|nr:hypothetical protein TRFO_17979 [Tritrichomonas foetus]|eukprot:OHT12284.1 hypothetical protein TRFO_17979 [Tritrichomonas foetus]
MKCDSQSKGNINCCFEKDNSSINPTFIFKGMILDRKKSFKFYNIGKGDVIMAIEKNKFTQKFNFFLKTYDYDEFKNRLIQIKDRSFRRELSRIIDQKVTLKEDYLIRSAFSKRKSTLYKKDPNQSQIKIEDYSKNTEPSVDPLPLFIF